VRVNGHEGWLSAKALKTAESDIKRRLVIGEGEWYVRPAPNADGEPMGVVREGTELAYQGETRDGWHLVVYENRNAWVSEKAGRLES